MARITLTLDQLPPVDEPLRVQIKNTFVEMPQTCDDEFSFLDTNPRRMVTDSVLYKRSPTESLEIEGIDGCINENSEKLTAPEIDCIKRDFPSPNLIGSPAYDPEPHPEPNVLPPTHLKNSVQLKGKKKISNRQLRSNDFDIGEDSKAATITGESHIASRDSPLQNLVWSPLPNAEPYHEPMLCLASHLKDSNPPKAKKPAGKRGKCAEIGAQASRANVLKRAHADLFTSSLSCTQLPFVPIHADSMITSPVPPVHTKPVNTAPITKSAPILAEPMNTASAVKFCHQCGNSRTIGHNFCPVCGSPYAF